MGDSYVFTQPLLNNCSTWNTVSVPAHSSHLGSLTPLTTRALTTALPTLSGSETHWWCPHSSYTRLPISTKPLWCPPSHLLPLRLSFSGKRPLLPPLCTCRGARFTQQHQWAHHRMLQPHRPVTPLRAGPRHTQHASLHTASSGAQKQLVLLGVERWPRDAPPWSHESLN